MTPALWETICYSALGHRSSQEQTYDIARLVLDRHIPGDFVECGVYAGASCAIMAHAIMDAWSERTGLNFEACNMSEWTGPRVHLFDSFAGIPRPGPNDVDLVANRGGESAVPIDDVRANMERWKVPDELLIYWQGIFSITVPWSKVTNDGGRLGKISLLRLDGDLYESTKVCITHLWPLVSPGGYVIVDDFNLDGSRLAMFEHGYPAPVLFRKPK